MLSLALLPALPLFTALLEKISQEAFSPSNFVLTAEGQIPNISASFRRGSLAQSVEHIPFKDGVDGSSPSRATNFLPLARSKTEDDCLGSPSSSGLGHYPFTVDTPVQIRLGTPISTCRIFRIPVSTYTRYPVALLNSVKFSILWFLTDWLVGLSTT